MCKASICFPHPNPSFLARRMEHNGLFGIPDVCCDIHLASPYPSAAFSIHLFLMCSLFSVHSGSLLFIIHTFISSHSLFVFDILGSETVTSPLVNKPVVYVHVYVYCRISIELVKACHYNLNAAMRNHPYPIDPIPLSAFKTTC